MQMKDIKLLALDMDGTLFTTTKEITEENRRALRAAQELGVKVVITTGRPLQAIQTTIEELGLYTADHYSITFNGGLVQRNNGEILDKSALDFADLETLQPVGGTVYSIPSKGNKSQYHQANPMLTFVELESLEELPKDVVYNKVVTVTDEDFLNQQIPLIPSELFQQYELFKSREIIFEVMPKGVHKAFGLTLLTKHLGLSSKNVMAMGDEENDLTMIEWAGLGVAMANGSETVKAVADAVTLRTNDQSGVAEAIEKYILKG